MAIYSRVRDDCGHPSHRMSTRNRDTETNPEHSWPSIQEKNFTKWFRPDSLPTFRMPSCCPSQCNIRQGTLGAPATCPGKSDPWGIRSKNSTRQESTVRRCTALLTLHPGRDPDNRTRRGKSYTRMILPANTVHLSTRQVAQMVSSNNNRRGTPCSS